jgi:hypothetical protein
MFFLSLDLMPYRPYPSFLERQTMPSQSRSRRRISLIPISESIGHSGSIPRILQRYEAPFILLPVSNPETSIILSALDSQRITDP